MGDKSWEDQLQYSVHSSGQKYVIKPNTSAKMVVTAIEELSYPCAVNRSNATETIPFLSIIVCSQCSVIHAKIESARHVIRLPWFKKKKNLHAVHETQVRSLD